MYIYLLFDDTSKSNPTSVRAGFIGTMWGYFDRYDTPGYLCIWSSFPVGRRDTATSDICSMSNFPKSVPLAKQTIPKVDIILHKTRGYIMRRYASRSSCCMKMNSTRPLEMNSSLARLL